MKTFTPIYSDVRDISNNSQWIYKFPNGRGASVIRGPYSYGGKEGLFELAVIKFNNTASPTGWTEGWKVDYSTPITRDVIGWLTEEELQKKLLLISKLPSENTILGKIKSLFERIMHERVSQD
jgi:hypothetical protein